MKITLAAVIAFPTKKVVLLRERGGEGSVHGRAEMHASSTI